MKLALPLLLASSLFLADAACLPAATPGRVEEAVLKGKELACIMGEFVTDAREVAKLCKISDTILPFVLPLIQNLIGVRDAARRSGVSFGEVK